jgi:hypothetical protein
MQVDECPWTELRLVVSGDAPHQHGALPAPGAAGPTLCVVLQAVPIPRGYRAHLNPISWPALPDSGTGPLGRQRAAAGGGRPWQRSRVRQPLRGHKAPCCPLLGPTHSAAAAIAGPRSDAPPRAPLPLVARTAAAADV